MAAYEAYNEANSTNPILATPVEVFAGSLSEAVARATASNSKDRQKMTQAEKSNAGWRLVCLEDGRGNASAMARASGMSRQTIFTMQRAFEKLSESHPEEVPVNLPWSVARSLAEGRELKEWDEDQQHRQAQVWAAELYKAGGPKFASAPDIFARALALYDPTLIPRLLETEAFADPVQQLAQTREELRAMGDTDF